MIRVPWLCVMAVFAACDFPPLGSGLAPARLLGTLSAGERDQLCSFRTEVEHAPRSVICRMGEVVIQDKASCVSGFSAVDLQCPATVSDAESCFHAFNDDPCGYGDGACTTLFTCVLPTD